jgi:hypothetical protein
LLDPVWRKEEGLSSFSMGLQLMSTLRERRVRVQKTIR